MKNHILPFDELKELHVFDQLPLSFWISLGKRDNYRICYWNKACEKIYGYTKEEAIGRSFIEVFVADDENNKTKEQAKRDCDAVISGDFIHPTNCLAVDVNKNGQEVILLTNVFRYTYQGVHFQAEIAVDLTPSGFIKFLDQEYRQKRVGKNHEVERTLRAFIDHTHTVIERNRDLWSRTFAHEIRSELGEIKHSLSDLAEKYNGLEMENSYKDIDRAQRALHLLSQNFLFLQGFKNPSNPYKDMENMPSFIFKDQMKDVISEFTYWASLNGIEIEYKVNIPFKSLSLKGNSQEFINAVRNLLSNAVKYSDSDYLDDDSKLIISITCYCEKEFFVVKMINAGNLSKNEIKYKFQPYYKDKNNPSEGLHLGLSISKAWVDKIGGEIFLDNLGESHVAATIKWPINMEK